MRRHALSLIELIASVGIVTLLAGLLLPAVQAAREAATRSARLNSLRQTVLAAHHHEAAHGRLPCNGRFPHRSDWPRQLGPYIDRVPAGVAAADSWRDGFISRGQPGCRFADVTDGLGSTVAFGAVGPTVSPPGLLDLPPALFRSTADPGAFAPLLFAFGDGRVGSVGPGLLSALGTRSAGD